MYYLIDMVNKVTKRIFISKPELNPVVQYLVRIKGYVLKDQKGNVVEV